jgi:hypothetical protein
MIVEEKKEKNGRAVKSALKYNVSKTWKLDYDY